MIDIEGGRILIPLFHLSEESNETNTDCLKTHNISTFHILGVNCYSVRDAIEAINAKPAVPTSKKLLAVDHVAHV